MWKGLENCQALIRSSYNCAILGHSLCINIWCICKLDINILLVWKVHWLMFISIFQSAFENIIPSDPYSSVIQNNYHFLFSVNHF